MRTVQLLDKTAYLSGSKTKKYFSTDFTSSIKTPQKTNKWLLEKFLA